MISRSRVSLSRRVRSTHLRSVISACSAWLAFSSSAVRSRTAQFEFLVGPQQGFFRPLSLGDVAGDAEGADHAPVGVVQGQLGRRGPGFPAVAQPDFLFDLADQRPPGPHDLFFVGPGVGRMLRGEEVDVGLADGLRRILHSETVGQARLILRKRLSRSL